MCLGCGARRPKQEFVRIVRAAGKDTVEIDLTGKREGRGCYICRNRACMDTVVKKKKLSRSLGVEIAGEEVERIADEFKKWL